MLINEWQTVPKLWDAVRYTVDHRRKMGQFILTGSAVPDKEAEEEREHSGTGRFAWLTMRPMTLFESGESNGKVSLFVSLGLAFLDYFVPDISFPIPILMKHRLFFVMGVLVISSFFMWKRRDFTIPLVTTYLGALLDRF